MTMPPCSVQTYALFLFLVQVSQYTSLPKVHVFLYNVPYDRPWEGVKESSL